MPRNIIFVRIVTVAVGSPGNYIKEKGAAERVLPSETSVNVYRFT
jgi:hypothetical protein